MSGAGAASAPALRVLAVDDEPPALEELAYLLRQDPRIASVATAGDAAAALRVLQQQSIDVLFLDIRMPGLDGLELARVLARFADPPQVVFVTAYDDFAVKAFELQAVDYVLKPVHPERLAEAVRRAISGRVTQVGQQPAADDDVIAVELGGVTRFVARAEVRYVEAHGDYARLHTATATHLVRVPLSVLEERWRDSGFVRIHRRHLVALHHIDELRVEGGRAMVRVGNEVLPVSRRQTRELRDLLLRNARPGRS